MWEFTPGKGFKEGKGSQEGKDDTSEAIGKKSGRSWTRNVKRLFVFLFLFCRRALLLLLLAFAVYRRYKP